jgi:hypothetical protein
MLTQEKGKRKKPKKEINRDGQDKEKDLRF